MLSLGVILFLISRTFPRISEEELNSRLSKDKTHWLMTYFEKIDEWLKAFFEKFLRRMKVWILKLDNMISVKLNKFKKETAKETTFTFEEDKNNK